MSAAGSYHWTVQYSPLQHVVCVATADCPFTVSPRKISETGRVSSRPRMFSVGGGAVEKKRLETGRSGVRDSYQWTTATECARTRDTAWHVGDLATRVCT